LPGQELGGVAQECTGKRAFKARQSTENLKHKALNPKQIRNPNAQNILDFDIWICLEIGFWDLEFSQ